MTVKKSAIQGQPQQSLVPDGTDKLTPIPLARTELLSHGKERRLDPAHGEAHTAHSIACSKQAAEFYAQADLEEAVYLVSP